MATKNIGFQSFYQSQLTSSITNTDLTIPLDTLPTPSEGYLVIESTVSAKREIIYYTSKTATAVVVPSGAGNGRGFDGTTAVSHTQGATVIMAPIGAMFGNQAIKDMLGITADPTGSWNLLDGGAPTVSSVIYNGNHNYIINFASDYSTTLSPGMRLRTTRTVAAPTYMGGAFNGTSHYFTKATPSGTLGTVTNNFTIMAHIEPTAYQTAAIAGRSDSTPNNTLMLGMSSTGQIQVYVRNAGNGNYRVLTTYQSVPLNKKTHVAASWTSGTVVIYLDGVSVPLLGAITAGTAPTVAGTGGDFSIGRVGAYNGEYFPGYISSVGIFDAVLSAATIRSYMSQALTGSEANCIGAWNLNNAATDANAAANNLTATGGVSYSARSPFGGQADGTISSTLDYGIITNISGTAVTVQVPEGCTIPTTGGIAGVSYATVKVPYGFPAQRGKWILESMYKNIYSQTSPTTNTWYNIGSAQIYVPIGEWDLGYRVGSGGDRSTSGAIRHSITLSTGSSTESDKSRTQNFEIGAQNAGASSLVNNANYRPASITTGTQYYLNIVSETSGINTIYLLADRSSSTITAECAYL